MAYLIDSDWVIDHLSNQPEAAALLARLAEEPMYISLITYMEVYQGALRTDDFDEALVQLRAFTEGVPVLPLTVAVAERCASLRENLRRQRKNANRRALDLLTAATALHYDLTLVTRNVDDFKDLPDLKLL